ncbi:hypothetical protein [Methylobacterium sp. Leaf399]|uniref:hypothetical protein n=1 Tax=Methylobacterium sp. Leaf399 TaxID=1736364 RepID=UPI001FCD34A9|nr:hypothetical protein [Methylobacterium sp. Leaf399]
MADEAPGALGYDARTRGPVPIPPGERDLQSVVAQPWFKVSDVGIPLEGPSFDRAGDLLFTDAGTGRVLLPGRDDGHHLNSTSMALRPGTDDLLIVTNDGAGGQGSTIFHARAFAKALPLFSHR